MKTPLLILALAIPSLTIAQTLIKSNSDFITKLAINSSTVAWNGAATELPGAPGGSDGGMTFSSIEGNCDITGITLTGIFSGSSANRRVWSLKYNPVVTMVLNYSNTALYNQPAYAPTSLGTGYFTSIATLSANGPLGSGIGDYLYGLSVVTSTLAVSSNPVNLTFTLNVIPGTIKTTFTANAWGFNLFPQSVTAQYALTVTVAYAGGDANPAPPTYGPFDFVDATQSSVMVLPGWSFSRSH